MTRLALVLALLAAPAAAQDRHEWHAGYAHGKPSWVALGSPEADGAAATVTFDNQPVHDGGDTFTLTHDGLTVAFVMLWNVDGTNDERLMITPPDGYFAWPETIQLGEYETGVTHIYPLGVAS